MDYVKGVDMQVKERMEKRFKIEEMLMGYEVKLEKNWYDHNSNELPNRIDFINRILDLFDKPIDKYKPTEEANFI